MLGLALVEMAMPATANALALGTKMSEVVFGQSVVGTLSGYAFGKTAPQVTLDNASASDVLASMRTQLDQAVTHYRSNAATVIKQMEDVWTLIHNETTAIQNVPPVSSVGPIDPALSFSMANFFPPA